MGQNEIHICPHCRYAVFGQVIEGIEVVDEIAGVQTGGLKGYQDVPVEVVVLLKAELVN